MPRFRALVVTVVLVAALAVGAAQASAACVGTPRLSGSFVQPTLPDSWSSSDWSSEIGYMQAVCIDTWVLQWTVDSGRHTSTYPSDLSGYDQTTSTDVVGTMLAQADQAHMKVYLGLNVADDWFNIYALDRTWIMDYAATANAVMDELWRKYGSHKSLTGWYFTGEPWNWRVPAGEDQATDEQNLIDAIALVANHAASANGKPVMIAPFFNTHEGLTTTEWTSLWRRILGAAPLSIIALQDGVGAGNAQRSDLAAWYSATKSALSARPSTALWADTETFTLVGSDGQPMAATQYVGDMQAVQPYVTNYLGFSFDHYISPLQVDPSYYNSYKTWVQTGHF